MAFLGQNWSKSLKIDLFTQISQKNEYQLLCSANISIKHVTCVIHANFEVPTYNIIEFTQQIGWQFVKSSKTAKIWAKCAFLALKNTFFVKVCTFFWFYKKETLQMLNITLIRTPTYNNSNYWGQYGFSRPLRDHFLDFRGQWTLTGNNFKTKYFQFLKFCQNMQIMSGQFLEKYQLNQRNIYCQRYAKSNGKISNLPKKGTKKSKNWHFWLKILKKLPGTIPKKV